MEHADSSSLPRVMIAWDRNRNLIFASEVEIV
jgi:hypothetical protein